MQEVIFYMLPDQHKLSSNFRTQYLLLHFDSPPTSTQCIHQRDNFLCHVWMGPACCAFSACRFIESGGVFKLEFGPKAFIVVSDPVVVRYLLKVWLEAPAFSVIWLPF